MQEVRRLRQERGWTQTQLAFHSGLAPSVISQIENDKRDPSASTLRKLAGAFGVEVGELFPKAQAPLPLDVPEDSASGAMLPKDPAEAAVRIRALKSTAVALASTWNADVELYEQHGRDLRPRTLEMSSAVVVLYQQFWGAVKVLQNGARAQSANPDPATWDPQSKQVLWETLAGIRALAELYEVIDRSTVRPGASREDLRAMREEFDVGPLAGLVNAPEWPRALEKARAAVGLV